MKTLQVINNITTACFDEQGTTISVDVTVDEKTETFHVQTVDGRYRTELGCWMFTDNDGENLDQDDYPSFDFDEIIGAAEDEAENNLNLDA